MKQKTYIFIGDSLTYGYGIKPNENWVSKLKREIPHIIINKGINGNTTTNMLNRFSEDVLEYSPSVIFVMGGTNDLLSNRPVKSIIDNIELMLRECLSIKSTVIIGIPPTIIGSDAYKLFSPSPVYDYCESNLPILRNELIKLCENYKVTYLDFYRLSCDNLSKDIFNDGIHLNVTGQDLLYSASIKLFNLFN